ncbi:type II secretion system F family protein [Marinobacterium sediminicola]|uniref:Tight adherence protein B n=1 Tax=Marinobacterium sediminicola TaxID=518898 RepID=A0ABY1RZS3_9GAMM|nr:type II secretion system F family protein [Marinobacterium sediminicola]ULG69968.1 type II secretion system F family protein [Marinobacterium sediminicola]SMR74418.1 tight adherence protein B [Marinobacterium sediminicola]
MNLQLESTELIVILVMVFISVFVLLASLSIPVFGEQRRVKKRLQQRLGEISSESDQPSISTLLRARYLKKLNPFERQLETLPGMASLARLIEQSGGKMMAYKVLLLSLLLGVVAFLVVWLLSKYWVIALAAGVAALAAPYLRLVYRRHMRLLEFEAQLPEAIDIIKRALLTGHPFSESLNLVAEGLEGPVSTEFAITYSDLSYGSDLRRAMLGLLERVPSVTLMAFVTAVLVQKETGGNLAEILENIGSVIRGRFRFQRRVKTLSAEGRLSAWILMLVPFGLFGLIYFTTPGYMEALVRSERGHQLIVISFVLMLVGAIWIRRLLRIEV